MGLSGLLYPGDQCCLPAVSYLTYCACRAAADRRWKDWLWLICWSYLWIVVHKWRPHNASTSSHLRWIGDEVKCWKSWTNWRSGDLKGQRHVTSSLDPHFFLRWTALPHVSLITAFMEALVSRCCHVDTNTCIIYLLSLQHLHMRVQRKHVHRLNIHGTLLPQPWHQKWSSVNHTHTHTSGEEIESESMCYSMISDCQWWEEVGGARRETLPPCGKLRLGARGQTLRPSKALTTEGFSSDAVHSPIFDVKPPSILNSDCRETTETTQRRVISSIF